MNYYNVAYHFVFVFFLNGFPFVLNLCDDVENLVETRDFGTSYPVSDIIYDNASLSECGCGEDGIVCIRKCCARGYFLKNRTCLKSDLDEGMGDIPFHIGEEVLPKGEFWHRFVFGMMACKLGLYRLDPEVYDKDRFYLQIDGKLWQPAYDLFLNYEHFCLDYFEDAGVTALACVPEQEEAEIPHGVTVGMIISMPFLLLTFIVYALLPERNLHGKSLMCYVITLFGAYFLLVFIQLYPYSLHEGTCKTLGLLCLFFFMVSFFWMNVMSIDIWWAFSGLRGFSGSRKEAERKRFLLYSAYAWGMPFLHVILIVILTVSIAQPNNEWYNPGMGDGQCWFRSGVPTLLYFYGPMAIIIIANVVLFIVTACKIKQVQQDTAMLRKDESKKHSYENDKQRFNLYLKLMLAMGVNWSMEIVSWAVNWQVGHVPPPVWYITDFCNALYGVFIFFIFVFKRNIWKLLKRRYYLFMGKPHLARSVTQTASSPRTTGSSLSHTVTTDTKSYVNDTSTLTSEVA